MAPDGADALRHGDVAIGERPLDHRLVGQERLQLTPKGDAFEQRARPVQPRQAQGQGRVHVEMAVDEGRADQPPAGVDLLARRRLDPGPHGLDQSVGDDDVEAGPAVGESGMADDQIGLHRPCPYRWPLM